MAVGPALGLILSLAGVWRCVAPAAVQRNVSDHGRTFSFGRFRQFLDGCEFVFNPSDSSRSSRDIQPYLISALRINVLRWELL